MNNIIPLNKYAEKAINNQNIKDILDNDIIGRNKKINTMLKMLDILEENNIIGIDGKWGTGKTIFLKSIEYLLEKDDGESISSLDNNYIKNVREKYSAFYYDAWKNDDSKSALQSIIYNLMLKNNIIENDKIGQLFIEILKVLITKFCFNGVDIFTNNKLDEEINLEDAIKSKKVNDMFLELIDKILEFESKQKFLLIIDEIDRCKPLFAVDLLESIKHFCNSDKIVILIGTNNRELAHCIKNVYGNDYNGQEYLDKIFDLTVSLDNDYIDKYNQMCFTKDCVYESITIKEMCKIYSASMRNVNRIMNYFGLISNYIIKEESGIKKVGKTLMKNIFLPYVICLKVLDLQEYYSIINDKDIRKFLEFCFMENVKEYIKKIYEYENNSIGNKVKDLNDSELEKEIKEEINYIMFGTLDEKSGYKSYRKDFFDILSFLC